MANEITFGYITGKNLYVTVMLPDGSAARTARKVFTESVMDGYYVISDAAMQAGDFVIVDDNDLSQRVVGQGQYKPEMGSVLAGQGGITPAGYVGNYQHGKTVYFPWTTNKVPTTPGTIKVYKQDGTGEVTSQTGITDTRHFDSDNPPDGLGANSNVHICSINLSVNTFYAPKNDYEVILEGVEIDGETFNTVIASFSIEKRHAIPDFIRD